MHLAHFVLCFVWLIFSKNYQLREILIIFKLKSYKQTKTHLMKQINLKPFMF
jgi:hypothetical protein